MKPQNDLDKLFKSLSEEKEFLYREEYWKQVAPQLPEARRSFLWRGYYFGLFTAVALLLLGGVMYFVHNHTLTTLQMTQQELVATNKAQTKHSDAVIANSATTTQQKDTNTVVVSNAFKTWKQNAVEETTMQQGINTSVQSRGIINAHKKSQLSAFLTTDNVEATTSKENLQLVNETVIERNNADCFILPIKAFIGFKPSQELSLPAPNIILRNKLTVASNYLGISAGVLSYAAIRFKSINASMPDNSPYLQLTYNHAILGDKHWSAAVGAGINLLRIRGADSLIYNDTYYSFGALSLDSLQVMNSSISQPPLSKKISQQQLLQVHIPLQLHYQINKKHALQFGTTIYYLMNVKSTIVSNESKTATLFNTTNESMESTESKWGYMSGISSWQCSVGILYQYHLNKHWLLQTGVQKMLNDMSQNTFYGNERNNAPYLFNAGIVYKINTKF